MAKKIILVPLALLILSGQAFSQLKNRSVWTTPSSGQAGTTEPDTSAVSQLSEVVVTASRTEKKLEDVGRSVSVISQADIKNTGANSLAELLSMAEGIYVAGVQQNFGANQSLFIRGANSNQSVVLIDGIPVADPSTPAGALDISELSLGDIDHIEIVRGSHSTLYGSSAIGGVINIITAKKMKEGLNLHASGTGGSFGEGTSLVSENIAANYTTKHGIYAGLNFNNANVNGQDATVDTATVPGLPRDMDGMNRFDCGGKVGFRNGKWDLCLSGKSVEKTSDIDDREFDDDDNYTLDFSRRMFSYGFSGKVDTGFIISVSGGNAWMERTSVNDSSVIDAAGNYDQSYYRGDYTGTTTYNELQVNFGRKGYNLVISGGSNGQTMNQKIYSYSPWGIWESDLDSLKLESRTNSFFILADLNGSLVSEKAKNLSLSIGARNNHNNTFGSSITYQVSPVVKVGGHSSVYANFSSGYTAPSLYQLHSPDKDFTSLISRSNVNLRPETSRTSEFGIYQKINDQTGIRIGYHQTVVRDVIEYVYLWNKSTPVGSLTYLDYRGDTYMNLGRMTTEGVELEAHGNIGTKFSAAGTFSYLRGKYRFNYESVDSVKSEGNHVQLYSNGGFVTNKDVHTTGLARRPVTANISVTYNMTDRVFFKAVTKYVSKKNDVFYDNTLGPYGALGKTPVDAYTLVDLVTGAVFNENLSGLVRIENIFNVSYSEIRGYTARGRGVYLTVHYSF